MFVSQGVCKVSCFTDGCVLITGLPLDKLAYAVIFLCVCKLQLNPDVNVFQRKFVNEVRRCEEMDRKLSESQPCII